MLAKLVWQRSTTEVTLNAARSKPLLSRENMKYYKIALVRFELKCATAQVLFLMRICHLFVKVVTLTGSLAFSSGSFASLETLFFDTGEKNELIVFCPIILVANTLAVRNKKLNCLKTTRLPGKLTLSVRRCK